MRVPQGHDGNTWWEVKHWTLIMICWELNMIGSWREGEAFMWSLGRNFIKDENKKEIGRELENYHDRDEEYRGTSSDSNPCLCANLHVEFLRSLRPNSQRKKEVWLF